jgi:hypothetical protein
LNQNVIDLDTHLTQNNKKLEKNMFFELFVFVHQTKIKDKKAE